MSRTSKAEPDEGVSVICEVAQVRTLVDGGLRITLDLPEDRTDVALWCMDARLGQQAIVVEMRLDG